MPAFINLTGMQFDRLTVIRADGVNEIGQVRWLCKCRCGNRVVVDSASLTRGLTRSCGCLMRELNAERARSNFTKHGGFGTKLYAVWNRTKNRCQHPNVKGYEDLGGRGIKWYEGWDEFPPFKAWALEHGYEEGLVLDRKDREGDFTPDNAMFVDRKTLYNHSRKNTMLTYGDRTMSISNWSKISGVAQNTIAVRVRSGWPIGPAIFAKPGQKPTDTIIDDEGFMVLWPVKGGRFDDSTH